MFIPPTSDPRRRARIITSEIIALSILIIAAMWVMAGASIMAAREAALGGGPCRIQGAFTTLPAFRQRVQTYTRAGAAPTMIRTFCRFGSNRRLVATIEWLRLWPNAGPLPQL